MIKDALNIEPSVGFFTTPPGRFGPVEETAARVARPGSGMMEEGWLVYFRVDSQHVGPPRVVEVVPGFVRFPPEVGPDALG